MRNLYFDFSLKIVKPKTNKRRIDNSYKRTTGLIEAIVFIENGKYKVKHVLNESDDLVLDFTEESFSLKGRENVWYICKTNEDKRTRFIRFKTNCRVHPGLNTMYVPFAPKWIVNGYIVKSNGKMLFDFNDIVDIYKIHNE